MNKTVFLVHSEDNDFIGVCPDLRCAKRLAREEFSCRYDLADLRFTSDWDELNSQRYWVGESHTNPVLPVLIISEVPFFPKGTRFPFEILDLDIEDLPNFLRRQAE